MLKEVAAIKGALFHRSTRLLVVPGHPCLHVHGECLNQHILVTSMLPEVVKDRPNKLRSRVFRAMVWTVRNRPCIPRCLHERALVTNGECFDSLPDVFR